MSWQPDIGAEITRKAISGASGRSQLRSTPGASNVQEAIFKSQLQKSKSKPASPKPVSSSTRQSLTEGAITASKAQKAEQGAAITRKAIGATVPAAVGTGYAEMLMDSYSGLRNPSAGNTYDVPTEFNKEDFKGRIIEQSIWDNRGTGGRHPDAAPLKGKGEGGGSESAPPERSALDRSKGTQTSPAGNGGGINQDRLNDFAGLLGSNYGISFNNGFQSNDLPGMDMDAVKGIGAAAASGAQPTAKGDSKAGAIGLGTYAASEDYVKSLQPDNPQAGTSSIPDEAEIKSSVPVGLRARNNRDGLGVDDRFAAGMVDETPAASGISDRSRAFLDYDGPGGSLMALRAAEASQGYIRQGGKNYGITGTGEGGKREFTEFNDDGRRALVKDGNSSIDHPFMDQYAVKPAAEAPPTPDVAQSPEIGYTTKMDLDPQSKQHSAEDVNFGVGDATFDQLEDFESNTEKITIDPIDWMNMYRGKK